MTVALPRRSARREVAAEPRDLAHEGVHRDPGNHDPIATGSLAQRFAHRASGLLSGKTSRRSFLTRTAVVGSALAVGPIDFILKPGTAYGYLCGTCTDGWTAFCCTINSGRNSCPAGSFVAGWWKADNAAYCCGAARYIIDCNATCPTQCNCRCSGASCDGRKTCCNQFRYGQCNTQIACYGPVVCRVATCTPPWQYDPSCTTSSATDNRTRDHGAPCLTTDCGTPIARKYAQLGGSAGVLGPVRTGERAVSDQRGRVARYANGNIYWTSTTGAQSVHGRILSEFAVQGGVLAHLRYPTSDPRRSGDNRSTYSNFERGRIYDRGNAGVITVPDPFFAKHESWSGVYGPLGYPSGAVRRSNDNRSTYQNYEKGRIYVRGTSVTEIHGAVFTYHESTGGVYGPLGYPLTDLGDIGDRRGKSQWFEKGILWYSPTTKAFGLWGPILDRYLENGHARGFVRYPTSDIRPAGDGRGSYATFERGTIYVSDRTPAHQVHGAMLPEYLLVHGGPRGPLGYPISELDPRNGSARRFQRFENGTLEYIDDNNIVLVP